MTVLSVIGLVVVVIPLAYWYLLALGSVRRSEASPCNETGVRFAVAIPAHDEAPVIGQTTTILSGLDYPADRFDVYVVADHCKDATASIARSSGAICFERVDEPSGSKAAALTWLFAHIWDTGIPYDAIVVFDADTQVDPGFLRAMAARLLKGEQVIQGQHRIQNPQDSWYAALAWAMFLIDNRIQNLGRANLGFSAKNMGDSICLRSDVLHEIGWGKGLTEDYELRLRLLLNGINIAYEPAAVAYGEAPATWAIARRQRERWLAGTSRSTQNHLSALARKALRRSDLALLDGLAQLVFPSYSSLSVLCIAALLVQIATNWIWGPIFPTALILLWLSVVGLLILYPFLGLVLERAPVRAYLAILIGPAFIFWRTWLALVSRLGGRKVAWVRTPRRTS